MVPFFLHLHRCPPPGNVIFSLPLLCSRSQRFSLKFGFFKHRRFLTYASATEGNGKDWWKRRHTHVCNVRYHRSSESKECFRKEDQPLLLAIKVVAGLLGVAFFLSKMRGLHANTFLISTQVSSWFVGNSGRGLPVASLLQLGQFSAITSALDKQSIAVNPRAFNLGIIREGLPRFSYFLDIMLERHPISYVLFLTSVCLTLICIGGVLFSKFRSFQQKTGDSFWDAWACICSSSTHLKEKTALERGIGMMLAVGGLLFYSLLISTMTTQFKIHMERLREGAHSEVMEEGHVVICGTNNRLPTVLRQLNKSHQLALREGSTKLQKQTVLLLSEHERKVTEKMVSDAFKELPQLNILTRSGNLSNTTSFVKVGAKNAHSIIVLSSNANKYDADAESLLTVFALQPLLEKSFEKLVVEVFNLSTAELLKSSTGLRVNTLQNLSSKVLVQCARQPGLIDVYGELLEHDKQTINVRSFPTLAGITYQQIRRGFSKAIVCGLIQEGKVDFHPPDHLMLKESDKLLMICAKDMYKSAPDNLIRSNNVQRELLAGGMVSPSLNNTSKEVAKAVEWRPGPKERVLVLGWHPRVSEMIIEFDDYVGPGSELIILADTSKEEREYILSRKIHKPLRNVYVNHQVGNPMSRTDVKAAILHSVYNSKSGHSARRKKTPDDRKMPLSILVITDQAWKAGDHSRPDKRSVLALLLAEEACKGLQMEVNALVAEFVDHKLGKQVMDLRPNLKAIGTDEILGLVTAQVAEQAERGDVWTALLSSWGDEIYVKEIKRYLKAGEVATFDELAEQAIQHKEVAIGYTMDNQIVINPPSKEMPLQFSEKDALVVISEYQYT